LLSIHSLLLYCGIYALGSGFRATIPMTLGTLVGVLVPTAARRRMNKGAAVAMVGAGIGVAVS